MNAAISSIIAQVCLECFCLMLNGYQLDFASSKFLNGDKKGTVLPVPLYHLYILLL